MYNFSYFCFICYNLVFKIFWENTWKIMNFCWLSNFITNFECSIVIIGKFRIFSVSIYSIRYFFLSKNHNHFLAKIIYGRRENS